jgi:dephospho-CoA kinase
MLLVGLTGGIGAGKSTVAGLLEERGAVVIDADQLARDAVAPGTPGLERVRELFGEEILLPSGQLDRARLGTIVFADPDRRRALEEIVHPEVARRFSEAVAPYEGTDRIVVYSVPLLVERGLAGAFDAVIVVVAGEDRRIERLAAAGVSEEEARRRMAAQATEEQRAAAADVLIDNDGDLPALERQVDRLWGDLTTRLAAGG